MAARPSWLVLLLAVALAAVFAACGSDSDAPAALDRVTVRIGTLAFDAEVARSDEERAQGLGERDALAEDAGMLFVYEIAHRPGFWMRGMRFPLDFIWIAEDRTVAEVTENVPPPEPGTPEDDLPFYHPETDVLWVLEVNAGIVAETGIGVGDAVTFEPEP